MTTKIDLIRRRLNRFGWTTCDSKIITLGGNKLWLIFGKRHNQSFTVQSHTQREAWESAWHLTRQIQKTTITPPRILPFPQSLVLYNRAG